MLPRRLRGLLGVVVLWILAWTLFALVETTLSVLYLRSMGAPLDLLLGLYPQVARRAAGFGLVAGLLFAAVLALRGRHLRTVDALSPRRAALWGAAAGLVLALPMLAVSLATGTLGVWYSGVLIKLAIGAAVGAGTAGGAVALARRVPDGTGVAALGGDRTPSSPAAATTSPLRVHAD